MSSAEADHVAIVRRYFEACGTGNLESLLATLAPDVVHYFLPERFAPIRGAEHLARHVMMRGSEWYVIRDGRIAEIRAYLIDDPMRDTQLIGFPYRDRGYLMR